MALANAKTDKGVMVKNMKKTDALLRWAPCPALARAARGCQEHAARRLGIARGRQTLLSCVCLGAPANGRVRRCLPITPCRSSALAGTW